MKFPVSELLDVSISMSCLQDTLCMIIDDGLIVHLAVAETGRLDDSPDVA
jgi:hypothetical protein